MRKSKPLSSSTESNREANGRKPAARHQILKQRITEFRSHPKDLRRQEALNTINCLSVLHSIFPQLLWRRQVTELSLWISISPRAAQVLLSSLWMEILTTSLQSVHPPLSTYGSRPQLHRQLMCLYVFGWSRKRKFCLLCQANHCLLVFHCLQVMKSVRPGQKEYEMER